VLPFVIMGDVAGLEIVNPMAIVMLGSLVTTTLLSLFLLPALYLSFGAGAQPEPVGETPQPHGAPVTAGSGQIATEAERSRRFGRASERRDDASAHQEGGEGAPPGRRGE
jgi:hypothetical protein